MHKYMFQIDSHSIICCKKIAFNSHKCRFCRLNTSVDTVFTNMKNAKDGDKDMAKMSVVHNTNLILTYSYAIQSQ